jgi:hypothetical protein
MKNAVIFYGSMREVEMGSKSWHVLGDNVDYFVVTWDMVNTHYTDRRKSYPFELTKFPVPVKSAILVNFEAYKQSLIDVGIPTNSGFLYILYHWSLMRNLPGIFSYEKIVITRPDAFFARYHTHPWKLDYECGKVGMSGMAEYGVNDWLLTCGVKSLDTLHDLYHQAYQSRDFLDENGHYKSIHRYLWDKRANNPDKYCDFVTPIMHLVRPGYDKELLKLDYGPELVYQMIKHSLRYEKNFNVINDIEERILTIYNKIYPPSVDDK